MVSGQLRFIVFTKKKKLPEIQALLPTSSTCSFMCRGPIWKAEGQQVPLYESADISATVPTKRIAATSTLRECVEVENVAEESEYLEDGPTDPDYMYDD